MNHIDTNDRQVSGWQLKRHSEFFSPRYTLKQHCKWDVSVGVAKPKFASFFPFAKKGKGSVNFNI